MSDQEARVASVVEAYDAQGWHRTGTAVDMASAEWLASCLKDAGCSSSLEAYSLQRVVPGDAFVEVAGRREEGLPLFDAGHTSGNGVSGALGPLGSGAAIGVAVMEGEGEAGKLEAARREGKHRAIVAVTVAAQPGLQARNAMSFDKPFGPPVLQVSSEARGWLAEQAGSGASARVAASATMAPAQSANVVGRIPGRDPALAPVVVTTPRSGWWQCASERGGGIAAWLEVARGMAAGKPERDVWFVAFSGHELAHQGLNAFLAAHGELLLGAKVWVHFGANVGGATDRAVRLSGSTEEFLSEARSCLEAEDSGEVHAAPAGRVTGMEAGRVAAMGGRAISLTGGNAHFHLQSDRWPQAVDASSVARQARAITKLVGSLAGA